MMKSIKKQVLLLLLLFFSLTVFWTTVFASDKPAWTIDNKKMSLPKHEPSGRNDPEFHVHFTLDNKILISFLQRSLQTELVTKDTPEKSDSFFVALLLSRENGELIKKVEWPVMLESAPRRQNKILPLPSGGYVGIIDKLDFASEYRKTVTHLQTFDPSFNVIHDRVLDTWQHGEVVSYNIIVPLSGKFFTLSQKEYLSRNRFERVIEIINSITFEQVERFEQPNFRIMDILEDRLLSVNYSEDTRESYFFEKNIGALRWNGLGLTKWSTLGILDRRYANPRFIYNGAIVDSDSIGPVYDRKSFWVIIEDDKKSDPVFEGCISKPSWNTPIVACEKSKVSAIRSFFDLFGKDWVEAYDLSTRKVLLKTKAYSQDSISGEKMVDYAISPDGDSIILMTNKKIELYNVKPKKENKY